jgi:uncharacterized glyoxalase superfamily protein PhnB
VADTLRGKGVMPSLTVNDLTESLTFFEALGFEIEDRWEHEGVLVGAMLKGGHVRLGLTQDDGKKGKDRPKGIGLRLHIEADNDIDQVAARAKAMGIPLGKEPHNTNWGTRAFEVTDPTGFLLTISSPSK